jgi:hypothetical protein
LSKNAPLQTHFQSNTKSHHRLTIACLAAAAIERVREAIWTIQNGIWYNLSIMNKMHIQVILNLAKNKYATFRAKGKNAQRRHKFQVFHFFVVRFIFIFP